MRTTERQSNFEILRCILMLCVVTVHYVNPSMGGALNYVVPQSIHYYFIHFVESAAIISVNGFVLLAGYFGYKKTTLSLRKPIGLLLYVIAYNYLFYFIDIAMGRACLDLKYLAVYIVPRNWYIILYVTLLVISPYLNIVIQRLSKRNMLILLGVLMTLFSLWSTVLDFGEDILHISLTGSSTIAISGAQSGYTIVNFVLLYCIGAAIHKWNLFSWKKGKDALLFWTMVILIFAMSLITQTAWFYSNVLVILSSVFLFNFCRKLNVQSKVINTIAGATLGVYLISTKGIIIEWFWSFFRISEYATGNILLFVTNLVICVLVTFVLCAIIDMICRGLTGFVSARLDKNRFLNKNIIDLDGGIRE